MSLDLLGEGFDLHAGGQDLRFPHHENERAQAVALGKTFANHWMHNGFVVDTEGEKMSKSLGNVSNLLDLIDIYDPRAYRMVLLQSHYRSPVKITSDSIGAAINSLAGLDSFAARTTRSGRRHGVGSRRARRVPRGDGRRPRHAEGDGADLRHGAAGQRRLRRRRPGGRVARRRRPRDLRRGRPRVGCRRRRAGRRARRRRPRSTRPGRRGTSTRADAIRAELQAGGWTVETTKDGTTIRR